MFKGIEQAKKDFDMTQDGAVIFADLKDGSVWCDVFDIPTYHDDHVVYVVSKDDLFEPNETYAASTIRELAEMKKDMFEQGYDKLQIEADYNFAEVLFHG
ncbi:hypothetical protein [Oceanobacillus jeddahense]|uniref:hypothetical protein n=1 Tax=Oceanobacillus jeddahense TaxID=1462527 RepID=UPI000596010A|nr:hypothetical protein [Oceanobacillus jeddahense]